MKKINNYNYSIDNIRALAIIFVIIVHISTSSLSNILDWTIITTISSAAKIAVPLFIILSGALLLNPEKTYTLKEFYHKRIARIGIPLIFWPFFYYFCFLFFSHKAFSFINLFNDYIFLNMYFHLYFLYIIFGLYIVTPLLKPFIALQSKNTNKKIIIILLIYTAIYSLFLYWNPTKFNYWTVFTVFIPFIPYFYAGAYLIKIKLTLYKYLILFIMYIAILAITVIFKFFLYTNVHNAWIDQYPADVLSINVIPLSIVSFVLLNNIAVIFKKIKDSKIIKYSHNLSIYSFGIYLIHPVFLYLLKYIPFLNNNAYLPNIFVLVIRAFLILLVSYISIYCMGKIPYVKKLVL